MGYGSCVPQDVEVALQCIEEERTTAIFSFEGFQILDFGYDPFRIFRPSHQSVDPCGLQRLPKDFLVGMKRLQKGVIPES